MMKKLTAAFCVLCFLSVSGSLASEEVKGMKTATDLNFVLATTMETKVKIIETISIPVMAGMGPLTAGNQIQFKLGGEFSPVSLNGTFETVLTPIAFLQFNAGASFGSGWNIPIANGLRMNEWADAHDSVLTGGAFSGLVWSVKGGSAFQFDYAALKPGDWNHIVIRTYHAFQYRALSSSSASDSWLYESDSGENRNGWNYYGNYFLGYKMPLVLDTVGLLFEEDLYLYDTADRKLWGDDIPRWTFGFLGNFAINKKTSIALLVQGRTMRNFTKETEDYGFYQDRRMASGEKTHIKFYRAALNATIKLK